MRWWSGLLSRLRNLRRSQPEDPKLGGWWRPGKSTTGVPVTHDSALTYSAVWACCRVISESLAQMSWHVYQGIGEDNGRRQLRSHPADWLLSKQANLDMSAFVFRRQMLTWALLWGNAYAEIERDFSGRPVWLWPISPDRVTIDRDADGLLIYRIYNRALPDTILESQNVFHLRGVGADGIMGYSVVSMARQSIGLGLAEEEAGAALFGQGMLAPGAVTFPGKMSTSARDNLNKSIDERWLGMKNARRPLLFEEGMGWIGFGMPPDDAQFLESRKFQLLEICRWFRVPPHKIAELERATFSNIEHQAIEFVVDTLVPWAIQLEQEADLKLFGANRQNLFTKLNVSSLLRGDQKSRFDAYAVGRQWGWLSVNDVRRLEDMNPLPAAIGESYLSPLNYAVLPLGQRPQPQTMPMTPDPDEMPEEDLPEEAEDRLRLILRAQLNRLPNGHHTNGVTHAA